MYNRAGAESFLEQINVKTSPSQVGKNHRTLPICIWKKVLARSVRCLIQMRSGGAASPPAGSKAGDLVGKRGEVPRISENLAFCTSKNDQKQQDFR